MEVGAGGSSLEPRASSLEPRASIIGVMSVSKLDHLLPMSHHRVYLWHDRNFFFAFTVEFLTSIRRLSLTFSS